MKIRPFLLAIVAMIALSSCAQTQFTALEQQQISIEDPTLFEKSDAFTIDFSSGRDRDYSFPLPVGKAKVMSDYSVEIETTKGDAVKSMFAGVVRLSRRSATYGNVIVVRHGNGLETMYANNAENLVKSGDRVKAGQTIAIVGTEKGRTFCRFALMVNGSRINPSIIFSSESHLLRQQVVLFQKTANWKVNVSVMKEPVVDKPESVQWWSYPLPGAKVISPYGSRGGRRHTGVDLKTVNKDNILAAFDGEVVFSGPFSGYGNLIRPQHLICILRHALVDRLSILIASLTTRHTASVWMPLIRSVTATSSSAKQLLFLFDLDTDTCNTGQYLAFHIVVYR